MFNRAGFGLEQGDVGDRRGLFPSRQRMDGDSQTCESVVRIASAELQIESLILWHLQASRNVAGQVDRGSDVGQDLQLVDHGIRILFTEWIRSFDAIAVKGWAALFVIQQSQPLSL